MRAAQRVRIGDRRGPPAFAPVILLGENMELIIIVILRRRSINLVVVPTNLRAKSLSNLEHLSDDGNIRVLGINSAQAPVDPRIWILRFPTPKSEVRAVVASELQFR